MQITKINKQIKNQKTLSYQRKSYDIKILEQNMHNKTTIANKLIQ